MYNILRQGTSRVGRICTTQLVVRCCYSSSAPAVRTGRWDATLTPTTRLAPVASFISGRRWYSSMNPNNFIATSMIDSATFETVCSDTLESLNDYFEEVIEETSDLKNADVTYGDGVLTVKFGQPHGTYVINRQSPNRQIWLSSPTSGPKRYDFVPSKRTPNEGCWLYRHNGVTLHELLQQEISIITGRELAFSSLPHSKRQKDGRDDG